VTEHSPQERAAWALSRSCNGWRRDRICYSKITGEPLAHPHPACQRAQDEHDQILRDSGPGLSEIDRPRPGDG
jgi:hypothetical protein